MLVTPDLLWLDDALLPGRAVEITDGRVTDIRTADGPGTSSPHLLLPGGHDLQVNGGGGIMVNSDPSADALRRIAAAHRRLGTVAILPTVITDRAEVIDAAADAAIVVAGEAGQLGLHIEGPHISPERIGTHSADLVRPLDGATISTVMRLRSAGIAVMVTLAPECCDRDLLRRLVATGAVVSAGHSAASAEEMRQALADGVRCVTHLYNAMPPMTSRSPGILGAALLSKAYAGLIADGIHLNWDMVRIALAARPRNDLTFLVSDAMATVGGPDHFDLYGERIVVRDGALINSRGALAGAHVDLLTSLRNLHRHAGVPLDRAIAMVTDIPRAAIGLPRFEMLGVDQAKLIALDRDLRLLPSLT